MAIPTPRSFVEILSEMLATFTSRAKIRTLKVGNPILTILEAAAQSDVRSSQDLFSLLESNSVDYADANSLREKLKSEGAEEFGSRTASGFVNFSDTTITKIQTAVYQNNAVPGTTALQVADASAFPAAGSIYIGRNTANYEGPIAYTAKTDFGSYWTLTLSSGVVNFHDSAETVILSQGSGLREIPVGTIVQVPAGADSIQFSTKATVFMEDGEQLIENVEVVCLEAGTVGNVPARSIKNVVSSVFPGCSVINPTAITNGFDLETVEQLRARLKKIRASKTKGTDSANEVYSLGVSSSDNKTVVSSKIYEFDKKATLYIDDGTGYEESFAGISNEVLVGSALGGEQYFNLSQRPVANAFLISTFNAPFDLSGNPILSVLVNGVATEHQFSDTDFKNPYAASIFEIAASINGNPLLNFYAKTTEASKICLFGKNKENEIQGSVPSSGSDANDSFGFSLLKTYTLRLFKNGLLLNQDGEYAFVYSEPQNLWGSVSTGSTLLIKVDGTTTQTVTVTDQDFIDNLTGYISVSQYNSLASWATVLNAKIAGVTVTISGSKLLITSNRDQSSLASVEIVSGSLVTAGMFSTQASTGRSKDFEFNKNFSQVKLVTPLEVGDELRVSSPDTRAFTDSEAVGSSTNFATDFTILVFHNSEAENVATGLSSSISLTLTNPATRIARYTSSSAIFLNLQINDWIYAPSQTFAVVDDTLLRVSDVDPDGFWFETERDVVTANTGEFLVSYVTRSSIPPEAIVIPAGSYSPTAIVSTLNEYPQIKATLTSDNAVRLGTRTYKGSGSIYLAGTSDSTLVFDTGTLIVCNDPEVAFVESGNTELGSPFISNRAVTTSGSASIDTAATNGTVIDFRSTDILSAKKTADDGSQKYISTAKDDYMTIGRTITVADGTFDFDRINDFLPEIVTVGTQIYTIAPFGFSGKDELSVSMDQDSNVPKTFQVPFYRTLKPGVGAVYGSSEFDVVESPSLNSLFTAFGTLDNSYFKNFAALMRARGKSHSTTANKTILFRNGDYGAHGERNRVAFKNATGPSKAMELSVEVDKGNSIYNIHLPSGATKTPTLLAANHLYAELENHSYNSTNISRAATTVTVTFGPSGVVSHGLKTNDIILKSTVHADFPAGLKTITGTTANTVTYTEAGAATSSATAQNFIHLPKAAGTTYTVTGLTGDATTDSLTFTTSAAHNFVVGDSVYFPTGHFESGVIVPWGGYKVIEIPSTSTVKVFYSGATTFTATLASGVTHTLSEGMANYIQYVFTNYYTAPAGATRSGFIVTLVLTGNAILGAHNFVVGDVVYITSTDADFVSGYKMVSSVTSNSISYIEAGANVASANPIYVSLNSVLTPNFAGIAAGDILSKDGTYRKLSTVSSGMLEVNKDGGEGTFNLAVISSPTSLQKAEDDFSFFALTPTSAATIVTWVNANAVDDLGNQLLTATLVPHNGGVSNDGSATISIATDEEFFDRTNNASWSGAGNRCVKAFPLFDGYQGIYSNNVTFSTSKLRFKDKGFSGELTSNADFVNEVFKIVPTTAVNVATLMASPAYSGFYNSGAAAVSSRNSVQLSHKLAGNQYNLQVAGGTANSAFATSTSGAVLLNDGSNRKLGFSIAADVSDLNGFIGNSWVSVQNEEVLTKEIDSLTGTLDISPSGIGSFWAFTGYTPIDVVSVAVAASNVFRFESHTNFSSLQDQSSSLIDFAALKERVSPGDFLYIVMVGANATNTGLKKVVGVDYDSSTIFFEGECVPETVSGATNDCLNFIAYNSWSIGDKIHVSNDALGSSNNGVFTISAFSLDGSNQVSATEFFVSEAAVSTSTGLVSDIVVYEAAPVKLYGVVAGISASDSTANLLVNFGTKFGYPASPAASRISKNAIITSLNKLAFDTTVVQGVDGYKYNTGLLAEVNKVIFGDEDNSFMYPGVAATGTDLDISGPFIKRINVSLAIRAQQADQDNLIIKVKNAVATVINQSAVGESIALSDIVDAANSIDGVFSVVMLSPAMTSSTDLIKTQPYEKARVLDVDLDISVGLLG